MWLGTLLQSTKNGLQRVRLAWDKSQGNVQKQAMLALLNFRGRETWLGTFAIN